MQLAELSSKLDPQQPLVLVCNSAYRSSMAAGILERKGFTQKLGTWKAAVRRGWRPVFPWYEGEKTSEAGSVPSKAVTKGYAVRRTKAEGSKARGQTESP